MDYYHLADEPQKAAEINKENGLFRMSVSMSTLAIDMFLKSVLYRMEPANDLLMGHNHAGILKIIETKYPKNDAVRHIVKLSRKYFKDSRYSNTENLVVFTDALAADFIDYVTQIKNYVDDNCKATLTDLQERFRKRV